MSSNTEFFKKHHNIIAVVEAIQQSILQSIDAKGQHTLEFTQNSFEGKRFSVETFIK